MYEDWWLVAFIVAGILSILIVLGTLIDFEPEYLAIEQKIAFNKCILNHSISKCNQKIYGD